MKIKKLLFVLLVASVVFGLIGCSENNKTIEENDNVYFIGTITEINENTALVTPNEDEDIRGSGDAVYISLDSNTDDSFDIGDIIRVEYDGNVMESYPLQINVISVEKIK